jgi:carbon-monoxide dehydrogenase large subunit
VPRAADMPQMKVMSAGVPCTTNPLGVKGAGESGTTAAPCAIVNAVLDAVPEARAKGLDMPVTAEKVWRAIKGLG